MENFRYVIDFLAKEDNEYDYIVIPIRKGNVSKAQRHLVANIASRILHHIESSYFEPVNPSIKTEMETQDGFVEYSSGDLLPPRLIFEVVVKQGE